MRRGEHAVVDVSTSGRGLDERGCLGVELVEHVFTNYSFDDGIAELSNMSRHVARFSVGAEAMDRMFFHTLMLDLAGSRGASYSAPGGCGPTTRG